MIIVKQFQQGDQGYEFTLGAINAAPKKRHQSTIVHRSGCVSDVFQRKTFYTYTVNDVEYVVRRLDDGNFELVLASDDRVPKVSDYCSYCGRVK